jgi:uncharacterized membrane protein (DUF373 family)
MRQDKSTTGPRRLISSGFTWVQDIVYVALAVLLAASAGWVLVGGGVDLARSVAAGLDSRAIVALMDRMLLALMIVELLYTVQVSFFEHTLAPEPFVLVALIASVRRILVITAEFGAQPRPAGHDLESVLWELGLLTVLMVVLVGAYVVLHARAAAAKRPGESP